MKLEWIDYLSILIPLVVISLLVYPFWRRDKYESFENDVKSRVEFKGKRWTEPEFISFIKNIRGAKTLLESSQDKLFVVLEDYKKVMGDLENTAYKQKEGLDGIPKDLSKEDRKKMMGSSGLSQTPIKDFYESLYLAKDNGFSPINVRPEHNFRKSLPRIAIPTLGSLDKEGEFAWINEKDSEERYDKEEEFYKNIQVYLPTFLSSVNEVLTNAEILRKNAGEASWGMRPRAESMKERADKLEKDTKEEAKQGTGQVDIEGFESTEDSCPKSIRIRIIKTVPYEYWGQTAMEINTKIKTIQELISTSIQDIQISENTLENMGRKGEQGKQKAQNAL